ncbi:MAG: hypothetical protein FWD06_00020 [Oscillospiraceae bacterium]|nr:hypothetical protein [Oscillospiraceae bacterium]
MKRLVLAAFAAVLALAMAACAPAQQTVAEQSPAVFHLAEVMQMDLSPYITLGQVRGVEVESVSLGFAFDAAFDNAIIHQLPIWIEHASDILWGIPIPIPTSTELTEEERVIRHQSRVLFTLAVAQQEGLSITITDEEFEQWRTEQFQDLEDFMFPWEWQYFDEARFNENLSRETFLQRRIVTQVRYLILDHAVAA